MKMDATESEHIEFKEIVNDGAVKTVAAFANSDDGAEGLETSLLSGVEGPVH